MLGCYTDMNEKLFGIDGKGCDAEIMISLGVVGKCLKGKTEHNKVMFEVGGELTVGGVWVHRREQSYA